jgi:hypothetical protein
MFVTNNPSRMFVLTILVGCFGSTVSMSAERDCRQVEAMMPMCLYESSSSSASCWLSGRARTLQCVLSFAADTCVFEHAKCWPPFAESLNDSGDILLCQSVYGDVVYGLPRQSAGARLLMCLSTSIQLLAAAAAGPVAVPHQSTLLSHSCAA